MLKRIGVFLLVNILIITTVSVVLNVIGVGPYLTRYGMDYGSLAAFCLVWGFAGAFISLAISRMMAKWMMGVKVIEPGTTARDERFLVDMVHNLSQAAGLTTMPEVGIYDSPDINAFATGPTKSRALVAVSSGLLNRMNQQEIEGVIGHEIAHVANGDMVTMTLLQGLVNAFVMFMARAVAYAITVAGVGRSEDDDSPAVPGMAYYVTSIALEIVFMILGSIVVSWFSRYREFRADAAGARLAGRDKMIGALKAIKREVERVPDLPGVQTAPAMQSLQISTRKKSWLGLFASHPNLDDRIAALESQI